MHPDRHDESSLFVRVIWPLLSFRLLDVVGAEKHMVLDIQALRSHFNWMYGYQSRKISPHNSIKTNTTDNNSNAEGGEKSRKLMARGWHMSKWVDI